MRSAVSDFSSSASLPTVHCLSHADTVHTAEDGERLAAFFGADAKVVYHDAGHTMPPGSAFKPVISYVDEAAPDTYRK